MTQLTIITPCHPAHRETLTRAVESVRAQTIPVKHLVGIDHAQRGTGYIRNRLLKQVRTPYVAFLDADDWLEPEFAEECLRVITPRHYSYTDWYEDGTVKHAPDLAWCGGTWHIVTAVIRTEDALRVGGFDEKLPALEDTEFYLKLVTRLICGTRVKRPLVHYTLNPYGRSQTARASGVEASIKRDLLAKYGGQMGCCGKTVVNTAPAGTQLEGDVLAMALWHGNRIERGRASGRKYPYMSYPRTTWVDPDDVATTPNLWRAVDVPVLQDAPRVVDEGGNAVTGLEAFAGALKQSGVLGEPTETVEPGEYTPDVEHVVKTAKKRLK